MTISRYRVDVRHIQQLEQSITIKSSNQAMLDGINELSKYLKHPEYSYLDKKYEKHFNIVLDNRAGIPGRHYIHSRGISSKIIDS